MKATRLPVFLTDEQVKILQPLLNMASDSWMENKPGMILAQIYPEKSIALCGFIPNDVAVELQEIMKTTGRTSESRDWNKMRKDAAKLARKASKA